jgi:hypothetical protein
MLNFTVFHISATLLNPFGNSANKGPIILALDDHHNNDDDDDNDDEYGAVGVMMTGRGNQSTKKETCPTATLCNISRMT